MGNLVALHLASYSSPIGNLLIAARDGALKGLWMEGQKYFPPLSSECVEDSCDSAVIATKEWLDAYFSSRRPSPSLLPLSPEGTEFRKRVWDELLRIPYGETVSYSAISQALGMGGKGAEAVAGAVAHNSISIIIPCHRVIGKNGSLTGYAGGLDKKLWLLRHEGAALPSHFLPGRQ